MNHRSMVNEILVRGSFFSEGRRKSPKMYTCAGNSVKKDLLLSDGLKGAFGVSTSGRAILRRFIAESLFLQRKFSIDKG